MLGHWCDFLLPTPAVIFLYLDQRLQALVNRSCVVELTNISFVMLVLTRVTVTGVL
jgi:hypothetical protein